MNDIYLVNNQDYIEGCSLQINLTLIVQKMITSIIHLFNEFNKSQIVSLIAENLSSTQNIKITLLRTANCLKSHLF